VNFKILLQKWFSQLGMPLGRKRLSTKKRRVPLHFDQLEDRVMPSVTFTSIASGSWQDAAVWTGGVPGHAYPAIP
jgi:hypothetical protein